MNDESLYELEELAVQPGTYFNPHTEVVVIVDDSASVNQEIFNTESFEGTEWVRVTDETAVDEERRDELLEKFQSRHHAGDEPLSGTALDPDDVDPDDLDPDVLPEADEEI
ncbi:MAG: hypothetical protein ACSLFI_09375 [Solirubrobacterales bacterium]